MRGLTARLAVVAVSSPLLLMPRAAPAQTPDAPTQTPDALAFLVSPSLSGQFAPLVAMDAGGRAVVLWQELQPGSRVMGRRFDPRGAPASTTFVSSDSLVALPEAVFMRGPAGFVTLWSSGSDVYARRHLPTGEAIGGPLLVGSHHGAQASGGLMRVVSSPTGELVGLWTRVSTGDRYRVFARWLDANLEPLTAEVPLSFSFGPDDRVVDVVAGPDRALVFVWLTATANDYHRDLHVQAYSAAGEELGLEFSAAGVYPYAAVRAEWNPAARDVVVAWATYVPIPPFGAEGKIFLQSLSLAGHALTPEPITLSESSFWLKDVACNVRGYCAALWRGGDEGMEMRVMRPDGSVAPAVTFPSSVVDPDAYPDSLAYGGNGVAMMVWMEAGKWSPRAEVWGRRMIASPGDEVCQRIGHEVLCDAGRTGLLPELRLASFGLQRRDELLFGDVDGDGRADPCRVRNGIWRCDADHEGGSEVTLTFAGSAAGNLLLGDLDGSGKAEACTWSAGALRCDTAHNGGLPELTLAYGRGGDVPLLGDLDGDGRDDLCLASKALLRCDVGHDGGRSEMRIAFGQPGDEMLLGDFDGDGRDDPCVFRKGTLLCDTAHDGGAAEATLSLGSAGDAVVLGNLDGL